jgi:hypothetical protein
MKWRSEAGVVVWIILSFVCFFIAFIFELPKRYQSCPLKKHPSTFCVQTVVQINFAPRLKSEQNITQYHPIFVAMTPFNSFERETRHKSKYNKTESWKWCGSWSARRIQTWKIAEGGIDFTFSTIKKMNGNTGKQSQQTRTATKSYILKKEGNLLWLFLIFLGAFFFFHSSSLGKSAANEWTDILMNGIEAGRNG